MSTTEYTPGPWRHDQDECAIIADAATDQFGCTPVMVVSLEGAMGGDDSTADARLIAAAPELLEACREILAWMDERGPMMGGRTAEVRERARAAIAKAEGRAATPTPESEE